MLVYCIITIEGKIFSSNKEITVDFGKDDPLVIRLSDSVRQQTLSVSKFNNTVDVLNYATSIGWNLVHLMPFDTGGGSTDGTLRYLMSREI